MQIASRIRMSSQGTEFQKKVWAALLLIPKGEVRSYEWVARKIGRPRAVRAVGSAVAKNPFAPDVPCHRVIRKDGSLGNYSGPGGVRRKRELLRREGVKGGVRGGRYRQTRVPSGSTPYSPPQRSSPCGVQRGTGNFNAREMLPPLFIDAALVIVVTSVDCRNVLPEIIHKQNNSSH